jgi:hypothetical protein
MAFGPSRVNGDRERIGSHRVRFAPDARSGHNLYVVLSPDHIQGHDGLTENALDPA